MNYTKIKLLHEGKAKSVFHTENPDVYIMNYRDDTSAFNGEKTESLKDKGKVNNLFNAYIMELLEKKGIPTHFISLLSDLDSAVKSMDMMPIECVVRNYASGSICKRLGIEKGYHFKTPVFEFFYKDDELGDPMINESHILQFKWANSDEIEIMIKLTLEINVYLSELFDRADITLVDYKLEFGRHKGKILLGDEFSPDGCRLWDKKTGESMDKDRFRKNMGNVIEMYKEVASRIGLEIQ